jgi:hypothetical protein
MLGLCAETHTGLNIKCPLLLSDFNSNVNVSINSSEINKLSNFVKIR